MKQYILFMLLPAFLACNSPSYQGGTKTAMKEVPAGNDYAIGFSIEYSPGYNFIHVFNPWSGNDTLASYVVVKDSVDSFPNADFILHKEPESAVLMSSATIGILQTLDREDMVIASSEARLISDSVLYQKYLDGEIIELGQTSTASPEVIIGLNPDLIFRYIYQTKESLDEKLINAGLPLAYVLEFMEPHPLGRAEWLKFVAAFTGDEVKADSIFTQIKKDYLHYSSLAIKEKEKPTVLDGNSYKGVWYASGGKSFPATLYRHAGADYYWQEDSTRGTIPLSFENIINTQLDADFWLLSTSANKAELLAMDERYSLLKSFQEDQIFHFGKQQNPNGGLDYYESGVIRPDILLKDLISVFHPKLLPENYKPYYLAKVSDK